MLDLLISFIRTGRLSGLAVGSTMADASEVLGTPDLREQWPVEHAGHTFETWKYGSLEIDFWDERILAIALDLDDGASVRRLFESGFEVPDGPVCRSGLIEIMDDREIRWDVDDKWTFDDRCTMKTAAGTRLVFHREELTRVSIRGDDF